MNEPARQPTDIVSDQLRDLDRDAYLATIVLPNEKRFAVQTLFTFAAELAAVRRRVSEPMPGEIRLQFWHDALEGNAHGDVQNNPLAAALFATIEQFELSKVPLLRMVAARRFDLYQDPMSDENQFEGYAGEVASILFQFAAQILDDKLTAPERFNDAAGHLGVAMIYARALSNFEYDRRRAQIFLPLSIFTAFGLSESDILAGEKKDHILSGLSACLDRAQNHLAKAEAATKDVTGQAKSAFAMLALIKTELTAIEKSLKIEKWVVAKKPDWWKIIQLLFWGFKN